MTSKYFEIPRFLLPNLDKLTYSPLDYTNSLLQILQPNAVTSKIKLLSSIHNSEKTFLPGYRQEMSMHFNSEEITQPLVSSAYESTDEEMDVDVVFMTDSRTDQIDNDSDIEVIARYREMLISPRS